MDFDQLVRISRETQSDTQSTEPCLTCQAGPGQPCRDSCDDRGAEAERRVRDQIENLPIEQFNEVLATARERAARDDDAPGFYWAWLAVTAEAEGRNL